VILAEALPVCNVSGIFESSKFVEVVHNIATENADEFFGAPDIPNCLIKYEGD
jgi:hypothetical protein